MSNQNDVIEFKDMHPPGETGPWGLLDTTDNTWIGDNVAPLVFEQYVEARIAARILDVRCDRKPKTTVVREIPKNATAVKRGELNTKKTGEEALKALEEGRAL